MTYVSTRDPERKEYTYSDVLLEGLAPDGGLFVPTEIPTFSIEALRELSQLTYEELFVAIRSRFIGDDISLSQQLHMATHAYGLRKFPARSAYAVTPVQQIDRVRYIQDLSGGPTAAFKDMALQAVGQDMQYVLARDGRTLDILGATSGDTGSAAGEAVIGNSALRLFMLSPQHGPTEFQQAQMALQTVHDNVHHIHYPGTFDDCQAMVKQINADPEFTDLGAMNSINWARIASQIPYYFSGYFQTVGERVGEEVDFVVPTGNFGNVLAGYIAKQMGLPIRNLIVATNENSVLVPLIMNGDYTVPPEVLMTSSPSMDIAVASNYERLFYWLSENDPGLTSEYMAALKMNGTVKLNDYGMKQDAIKSAGFWAGTSTHADRLRRIAELGTQQGGLLIDPHTADAVQVSTAYPRLDMDDEQGRDQVKIVCLSTAKPVKFEATIREALGYVPERTDERFIGLEARAKQAGGFVLLTSMDAVKSYIRSHR